MTKEEFFDFFNSEAYERLEIEEKLDVFLHSLEAAGDISYDLINSLISEWSADEVIDFVLVKKEDSAEDASTLLLSRKSRA